MAEQWHLLYHLICNPEEMCRDAGLVVGVLGCMAERLQQKLLDKHRGVDLVVGPDAYRDLPRLLSSLQVNSCTNRTVASIYCQHCCKQDHTIDRQHS